MEETRGTIKDSLVEKNNNSKPVAKPDVIDHSFRLRMFSATLKNIKRQLPSKCTMLAPFKNPEGGLDIIVRIKGKKEAEYFTAPPSLQFMQADVDELISQIKKLF